MADLPDPSERLFNDGELRRYIEATGENDIVDAKAAMSWTDPTDQLSLAKDIVAFCNSARGGALVIGKSQIDGQFQIDGVSVEQAKSFDTTKVCQWLASRFSPPVRATCHTVEYQGKVVVVITVPEFADVPVICTRDVPWPDRPKDRPALRQGAIYVRSANAQSTEIQAADQLRELVERSVLKRQDQLREIFNQAMMGQLATAVPTDEQRFDELAERMRTVILEGDGDDKARGAWAFTMHPDNFEIRWPTPTELETVISRNALSGLGRSFPQEFPHPIPTDWGVSGSSRGRWGLSHEGMFYYWEMREDSKKRWRSEWSDDNSTLAGGQWVDFIAGIGMVCDFFVFASRYAAEFEPTSSMRCIIEATRIKGTKLLATRGRMDSFALEFDPTARSIFRFPVTATAANFRAGWRDHAHNCIAKFVEGYPIARMILGSIDGWIDDYTRQTGLGVGPR